MKPPEACVESAFRDCAGVVDEVRDEYARFVPATGAGEGRDAWACCACAFARSRASSWRALAGSGAVCVCICVYIYIDALTIRLICSGVGGCGGSLPVERVARGGVAGRSAMIVIMAWGV